ncbi:MAG: hypothetical protein RLZZ338_3455 [Cyanobacteriota bacterium]|jgi:hypothetical protein
MVVMKELGIGLVLSDARFHQVGMGFIEVHQHAIVINKLHNCRLG